MEHCGAIREDIKFDQALVFLAAVINTGNAITAIVVFGKVPSVDSDGVSKDGVIANRCNIVRCIEFYLLRTKYFRMVQYPNRRWMDRIL